MADNDEAKQFLDNFLAKLMAADETNRRVLQQLLIQNQTQQRVLQQLATLNASLAGLGQRIDILNTLLYEDETGQSGLPVQHHDPFADGVQQVVQGIWDNAFQNGRRRRRR